MNFLGRILPNYHSHAETQDGLKFVGYLPNGNMVYRPEDGSVPEVLPIEQTAEYRYESLQPNYIRLITIHPKLGPGDSEELLCSLSTIDIRYQHVPTYDAISYTWPKQTSQVRIRFYNSDSEWVTGGWVHRYSTFSNQSFRVTTNVETILRRLRHDDEMRVIWIDQLCINQTDDVEKGVQVSLMGQIFSRAAKVHVWLGDADEENEETENAFQCIKRLAAIESGRWTSPIETIKWSGSEFRPWQLDISSPEYVPLEEWMALRRLFIARTWFRRAWTLQEVVLGSVVTVLCGKFEIEWDSLELACQVVVSLGIYFGAWSHGDGNPALAILNVVQISALRYTLRGPQDPRGLRLVERLLIDYRGIEATDPRDIIYSKLGMCRNSRPLPRPDYKASVRDAYVKIAVYWLYNWKHNLDMLNEVQLAHKDYNLPSWVPDWSISRTANVLASVNINNGFDATGHDLGLLPPFVTLPDIQEGASIDPEEPILLTVRGIQLMTIFMVQNFRGSGEILAPHPDPYPTTGESYTKVCSALLLSASDEDFVCRPLQTCHFWDYYQEFHSRPKNATRTMQRLGTGRSPGHDIPMDLKGSLVLNIGRVLAISECGFIGLVPAFIERMQDPDNKYVHKGSTLPGDIICLLFGARTPFVLRKLANGHFRLIGECFVHGLMHGEATKGLKEELIEDFVLE